MKFIGMIITTLVGIAFFFAIIGVFGLTISLATLALFITIAVVIFRRPQFGGGRQ
jgi:hypothetical protein